MRNILVPVEQSGAMTSVLTAAWRLAARFGGHLEGAALLPRFADLVVSDIPIDTVRYDDGNDAETEVAARNLFEEFVAGRMRAEPGLPPPRIGWAGRLDDGDVGAFARLFDVTVVGRPGTRSGEPRRATLEAVLFESGRPILIAPPKPVETIGDTVLIAWNRATETARTVALAKPLLSRASKVLVLGLPGTTPGPDAEQMAEALRRDDLAAEAIAPADTTLANGPAILAECAARGVDLLVKGGYTQSRLRQLIFGGATSHILANAELPVFMAH